MPHFLKNERKWHTRLGFELLTAIESQILSTSEIQRWYKNPGFSRLSNYRQSLKMTFYCQLDLTNGKNAQIQKLNNFNQLLNLAHSWRLILLCKTLRFPIFCYCTFLYRLILVVSYFHLCFSYLQNPKILPHEFLHQNYRRCPPFSCFMTFLFSIAKLRITHHNTKYKWMFFLGIFLVHQ